MNDAALTYALLQPSAYPPPVQDVQVIETHISRVFLAGQFAYKVRKPVKFDFVDFSTPQARHADCEAELRLNRRFAPALYLDVLPIVAGKTPGAVVVSGRGTPLEYAVRMRRFAQHDLLIDMVGAGRLGPDHVDALARDIAIFHGAQPRAAPHEGFGTPASIGATLEECLDGLARLTFDRNMTDRVANAARARAAALQGAFQTRLRHGHVRECHGDLHLGNIVLLDGNPTPFDCLEFEPRLRWIDTASDIAFPFMDLLHHGRQDLAYRLLNGYLERHGDYAGLAVLPFYVAMRALVRARVLLEHARQRHIESTALEPVHVECRALLNLAFQFLTLPAAPLWVMHGLSGSGKSTVAATMSETRAMVRVRSDVERKRLRNANAQQEARYSDSVTARTYRRLLAICRLGCAAGFPMIADATFLSHDQRARFANQARRLGVRFFIVDCKAPVETLRARIVARALARQDPSDADLAVLGLQLRTHDPLTTEERIHVVPADHPG